MPLLAGTWNININGAEGQLNITSLTAEGFLNGSITLPGINNLLLSGVWNEASQSLFFETMVPITGSLGGAVSGGNQRAQFFGYLFTSQGFRPAGADIKWVLCGHVSGPTSNGLSVLGVTSRRVKFGWYAEINQVV